MFLRLKRINLLHQTLREQNKGKNFNKNLYDTRKFSDFIGFDKILRNAQEKVKNENEDEAFLKKFTKSKLKEDSNKIAEEEFIPKTIKVRKWIEDTDVKEIKKNIFDKPLNGELRIKDPLKEIKDANLNDKWEAVIESKGMLENGLFALDDEENFPDLEEDDFEFELKKEEQSSVLDYFLSRSKFKEIENKMLLVEKNEKKIYDLKSKQDELLPADEKFIEYKERINLLINQRKDLLKETRNVAQEINSPLLENEIQLVNQEIDSCDLKTQKLIELISEPTNKSYWNFDFLNNLLEQIKSIPKIEKPIITLEESESTLVPEGFNWVKELFIIKKPISELTHDLYVKVHQAGKAVYQMGKEAQTALGEGIETVSTLIVEAVEAPYVAIKPSLDKLVGVYQWFVEIFNWIIHHPGIVIFSIITSILAIVVVITFILNIPTYTLNFLFTIPGRMINLAMIFMQAIHWSYNNPRTLLRGVLGSVIVGGLATIGNIINERFPAPSNKVKYWYNKYYTLIKDKMLLVVKNKLITFVELWIPPVDVLYPSSLKIPLMVFLWGPTKREHSKKLVEYWTV
jgi:hypothetical protein